MDLVNTYLKKQTEKISFIELKKNSYIDINGYKIENNIPLPIVTLTLVDEIKSGNVYEEIKVSRLIEGIIYILGIDPEFKYSQEYKRILYKYDDNIKSYILYKGMQEMKNENYEDGMIYFRALISMNNDIKALFNYGICLEEKAKKYFNTGQKKEGEAFLIESTKNFESILDIDEGYSLAYYKLGYHYRYYEQYQKARIVWEKFMNIEKDIEMVEEIRKELELIIDNADFEEGCNLIFTGKFDEALEILNKLKERCNDWWSLEYMIGLGYKGIGEYEESIKFFEKAIELNPNEVDVYNEFGISLYAIGHIEESIKVFDKAIEIDNKNYKTICNRGLVYLNLGIFDKATLDIDKAYELCPNDDTVKKLKMKLDSIKEGTSK